jgi:hypothetical protein
LPNRSAIVFIAEQNINERAVAEGVIMPPLKINKVEEKAEIVEKIEEEHPTEEAKED